MCFFRTSRSKFYGLSNEDPHGHLSNPLDDTIDPRLPDKEGNTGSIEDVVDLPVDDKEASKVLNLGEIYLRKYKK